MARIVVSVLIRRLLRAARIVVYRPASTEEEQIGAVYTRGLAELRGADADAFGGKSANLGELLAAGIPVPPGFALSADAYRVFVERGRPRRRDRGGSGPRPPRRRRRAHCCFEGDRRGDALWRRCPMPFASRSRRATGSWRGRRGRPSRPWPCARARSGRTARTLRTPASRRASSGCAASSTSATPCATAGRASSPRRRSAIASRSGRSTRRRWA